MSKTLNVGDNASITHKFTEEGVALYATLSTDTNPIHLDAEYAATTQFKQRLVHGMLVGGLFSSLIGTHLPGNGSIYMGQNLNFKSPVFFDMEIIARVEITAIHATKPIITLKTTCVDSSGILLIDGEATVYVPWFKRDV